MLSSSSSAPGVVPDGAAGCLPEAEGESFPISMRLWRLFALKSGGNSNQAGQMGGWYQSKIYPGKTIFFKQDIVGNTIKHGKNINEYFSANLLQRIFTDTKAIAKISLATPLAARELPDPSGEHIYVSSENVLSCQPGDDIEKLYELFLHDKDFNNLVEGFKAAFPYSEYLKKLNEEFKSKFKEKHDDKHDNFALYYRLYGNLALELYEHAYLAHNFAPELAELRQIKGFIDIVCSRPAMLGSRANWDVLSVPVKDVIEKLATFYDGLSDCLAFSLIIDDPDVHTANLMVVPDPAANNRLQRKVIRIDTAAAMRKFDDLLHLGPELFRYIPGLTPTNHLPEYPENVLYSQSFADKLLRFAKYPSQKLTEHIHALVDNVGLCYGERPILEWAKRLGVKSKSKENILLTIKNFIADCYLKKQYHAEIIAWQIKVARCFSTINILNQESYNELKEMIRANQQFFSEILINPKHFKFLFERHRDHKVQKIIRLKLCVLIAEITGKQNLYNIYSKQLLEQENSYQQLFVGHLSQTMSPVVEEDEESLLSLPSSSQSSSANSAAPASIEKLCHDALAALLLLQDNQQKIKLFKSFNKIARKKLSSYNVDEDALLADIQAVIEHEKNNALSNLYDRQWLSLDASTMQFLLLIYMLECAIENQLCLNLKKIGTLIIHTAKKFSNPINAELLQDLGAALIVLKKPAEAEDSGWNLFKGTKLECQTALGELAKSAEKPNQITMIRNASRSVRREALIVLNNPKSNKKILLNNICAATQTVNNPSHFKTNQALASSADTAMGHPSWGKKLAGALICLLGAALIVGCVAATFHTAGLSLPGVTLGAHIITLGWGLVAGGAITTIAGAGLFNHGRRKALSKRMRHLQQESRSFRPGA